MIREGAQAPQPPPLPTTPVPPTKTRQSRAAEDYCRERPVYQTRQASNLREKIVQLAYQKEQKQAVRDSTRLLWRQPSGKQQQQQQDCFDPGRNVAVYVCDLSSGDAVGGGYADLGTGEGGSRRYWDCTGLGESTVGIHNLSAAQTQNHSRDSSLFPPSAGLRSRPRFSECPEENESSRPLPKPAYVPDIPSKQRSSGDFSQHPRSSREACFQNPSGVPSQVYRSPQPNAEQINEASTAERHQRHSSTKLLTSSVSSAYRSRTTAHRTIARSLRTPSRSLVAKQQPTDDTEEDSTPSTSPRSQNSHSQPSSKNSGGQTDKNPQKTTSARRQHVHSPSIIPPSRSKESHQKPASKDRAGQNVHGETPQNNDTSQAGHTHPSSNAPVRSTEHNQSEHENVQHDVHGQEHEKNIPSSNGHVPSPPESPPRGRRTVVLRRAARILRANHMPTPPEVELKKRQDRWKDQGRPKTVRFVPEDSGRRNYSSGSSGGSPRQAAASRGMEEAGVGEVKGNALPSTPQHLQPQVWPRRVDPKNPSHFASSLEMFKRRLKMNQQRVVTEKSTEDEDYVIRLENITPLAEPIWQQVSGFKHSHYDPHPPSAQAPQEQQHNHHPDASYRRLPAGTNPAHPQSHAYKPSTFKHTLKTQDFSNEVLDNDKELLRYPHSLSTEDEGDEEILKQKKEEEVGRGEIVEEGIKEHTTTTSGKFRESSDNWTYVPLGDRGHVPLPQVKTYVLENNLTSLLQTRVQSQLPLALTQHNVRLHDIFLRRRSEREKMRSRRTELEGRTGFIAIGERGGEAEEDNVRSTGRVASADAECRMRRWLIETEHQRDQQPLVNFKIAIPAA